MNSRGASGNLSDCSVLPPVISLAEGRPEKIKGTGEVMSARRPGRSFRTSKSSCSRKVELLALMLALMLECRKGPAYPVGHV